MTPSAVDLVRPPAAAPAPPPPSSPSPGKFEHVLQGRRTALKKPDRTDAAADLKPQPTPADDADRPPPSADGGESDRSDDTAEAQEAGSPEPAAVAKPAEGRTPAGDDAGVDTSDAADAASRPEAVTGPAVPPLPALPTGETPDSDAAKPHDPAAKKETADDAPVDPTAVTVVPPPTPTPVVAPDQAAPPAAVAGPVDPHATAVATPEAEAEPAARPSAKPHPSTKAAVEVTTPDAVDRTAGVTLPPEMKPAQTETHESIDPAPAALPAVGESRPPPAPVVAALPPAASPDASAAPRDVAQDNVDRIVTSVRGELLAKGGTMHVRLDPPTLGTVNVTIDVTADGVLSASLQTDNAQATRLLSHNLGQLKTTLESAGVSVEHIQVKQAAPAEPSSNGNAGDSSGYRPGQQQAAGDQSARQEQHRREMLQRMWARLAGTGDPLDLVA